jgi:hypothetical protein
MTMGHIIRLPGDPHQQTQSLLPWYINGTLDDGEVAAVETHLAECAECRADLAAEQAIGADMSAIPTDVERGWAAMRARLESRAAPEPAPAPAASPVVVPLAPRRAFFRRPIPIGWALTAQAAALVLVAGGVQLAMPTQQAQPTQAQPLYHTLGSAPAAEPGNLIVIFRPDTAEKDLRAALVGSSARLVGGPTASDAYVLRVADTGRNAALARLRANGHVVLAEPVDGVSTQ